jgi:hypothetical protein
MRKSTGFFVDSFLNIFGAVTVPFLQTIMNPIRYVKSPDGFEVLQFYIRVDTKYDVYERNVYTILNLSSDIGGLSQTLVFIGLMLTFIFSDRLFKSGIMSEMYQVEMYKSKIDEKGEKD